MSNDLDRLDQLLGDDLVYTHSNGMVDTKESYLGALRAGVFRYTGVALDNLESRTYGDTAVVTATAQVTTELRTGTLETSLRYTAVWASVEGRERFVSWHSCPVPA